LTHAVNKLRIDLRVLGCCEQEITNELDWLLSSDDH